MPAINISQLKIQAAKLADLFTEPDLFIHDLNLLLDHYTNQTKRKSQSIRQLSLRTHYTPRPVLRQIEHELAPLANNQPDAAINLADALWENGSLESRILASRLLGMVPLQSANAVFTRLPQWLAQSPDKDLSTILLTESLSRLRNESPDTFFAIVEDWLKSPRISLQTWGLRALLPLITGTEFVNYPALFRILRPAIEMAGPATQLDIQACLQTLAKKSPTEVILFLEEMLTYHPAPMVIRTLRRILPNLPSEVQARLRNLVR